MEIGISNAMHNAYEILNLQLGELLPGLPPS